MHWAKQDRSPHMIGKDASPRAAFLETLSRCERLVLMMHFGDHLRASDIALILELPEAHIASVIAKLRDQAALELGLGTNEPADGPAAEVSVKVSSTVAAAVSA